MMEAVRLFTGALLAALASGCSWPTSDQATIRTIGDEGRALISKHPTEQIVALPKSAWPRTIAGLEPEMVSVDRTGIEIITKPDSDGGWGYHVRAKGASLWKPEACYSRLGHDVYWFKPC